MIARKSFWKTIWELEDLEVYGKLSLIIAFIFLTKFIETTSLSFNKWLYLRIGFIFILRKTKLLRKAK